MRFGSGPGQIRRGPVLFCLALLLVGSGCPRRTSQVRTDASVPSRPSLIELGRVTSRSHAEAPYDRFGPEAEAIAGQVRQRLARLKHLRLREPEGAYRLEVELGVLASSDGVLDDGPLAMAAVRAEPIGVPGALVLQAQALDPLLDRREPRSVRDGLGRVLGRVLADLDEQARLATMPTADLARVLDEKRDAHALATVIEIVAFRRAGEARPRLETLLSHADPAIADRAIGALVALGDRRAVAPLTRAAAFEDTRRLAKLLDGIASLGGPEAESYLRFVASGHEDEDIRNLASEALARLSRKQKPAAPAEQKP